MIEENPAQTSVQPLQPAPTGDSVLITTIVVLLRIVVGGVFMFSGFVKSVDPWGGYYKITEYLLTLGWHNLVPLASVAAFAICTFEFVFGVLLLTGAYRRVVPTLLLLFTCAMLPLTYWLATTNAVADCGCFGDALHLSNWATFWKNVLLAGGLVMLLCYGRRVRGLYGPAVHWVVGLMSFIYVLIIAFEGYLVQPPIDFRPFPEHIKLTTEAISSDGDDYVFVYERDGERRQFAFDDLPDEDDGWQFVERQLKPQPKLPPIGESHPMIPLYLDHEDITADVLGSTRSQLLLLFPDLDKVRISSTFGLNELYDYASERGVAVYGICSASQEQIEHWKDLSMAQYPMCVTDDADLKMFARGNPAAVYINNGTIRWKRAVSSLDHERLHEGTIEQLIDDDIPISVLLEASSTYLIAMLLLLLLNRSPLMLQQLWYAVRRKQTATGDEPEETINQDQ